MSKSKRRLFGVHDKSQMLHPITCTNTDEDIIEMKDKLKRYPNCIENINYNNVGPLLDAAVQGHDKCFQFLIEYGANVQANCPLGDVLEVCIFSGQVNNIKCIEYLINNKIFPLNTTTLNNYILPACIMYDNKPIAVDLLFKFGATVTDYKEEKLDLITYANRSPTVTAIVSCSAELLFKLLLHGAIVDHTLSDNPDLTDVQRDCLSLIHHTALYSILKESRTTLDILYVLHQFGANFWQRNRLSLNPLQVRQSIDNIKSEVELRCMSYNNIDYDMLMDSQITKEVNSRMIELMNTPHSLQNLCRLKIYHTYHSDYLNSINKLSHMIPNEIVSYLKFEEVVEKCVNTKPMTRFQRRLQMSRN